ncbi:HEAT repeat domain containing protein [Entamoeba histolytica]
MSNEDTPKVILSTYPTNLMINQPATIRYQTLRKLVTGFEKVGAVASSEKLTEAVFRVLISNEADKTYKDALIQIVPKLVKVLMKGPDADEKTKSRCIQCFIQPLSDFLVGTESSALIKSSAARALIAAYSYLDDDTFKYFLVPVVRGSFTEEDYQETTVVDVVLGIMPRLVESDYGWIARGIEIFYGNETYSYRKEALRMICYLASNKFNKEAMQKYIMKIYLKIPHDKAWIIRREFVRSMEYVIDKIFDEDVDSVYNQYIELTHDEQKQVVAGCIEILPTIIRNERIQYKMKELNFIDTFRKLTTFNDNVDVCLIKIIPYLIKLYPEEEEYSLNLMEKSCDSIEEIMRNTVNIIFKQVFDLAHNKNILLNIFEKLANDQSAGIKSEMRRYICDVLSLDTGRFSDLFRSLVEESNFRVKVSIAQHLPVLRTMSFYDDVLVKLTMSGFFGVREVALKEIENCLKENESKRSILFNQFLTYQKGNCYQRQALAYAFVAVSKGNEEYTTKATPNLILMLDDPISNVRISTLIALGKLHSSSQDVKFALSTLLKNEHDTDVHNIAEQIYARIC